MKLPDLDTNPYEKGIMQAISFILALLFIASSTAAQPPGPPPEAFEACTGKSSGSECRFSAPHGTLIGSCRRMREPQLVCVPAGAPHGGRPTLGTRGAPPLGRPDSGPSTVSRPVGANIARSNPAAQAVGGRIPDTGQGSCFDSRSLIDCPRPGGAFYGQDAHYLGAAPDYRDNGDGIVTDGVTGLMWQQAHNPQRLGWYQARQVCELLVLGGHDDWRLPQIKELFSIADFAGATGKRPFLAPAFEIREPDATILQGDPFATTHRTAMMGQTWSATLYSGDHWNRPDVEAAFFFNFLDGRIKQAPTRGSQKLFYRCVRGQPWGNNTFSDNGDGTVTDRASGLMWQKVDAGRTFVWEQALGYCQALDLGGFDDWRLPKSQECRNLYDHDSKNYDFNDDIVHIDYAFPEGCGFTYWCVEESGINAMAYNFYSDRGYQIRKSLPYRWL